MEFARLGAPLVRQLDDVGRACVAEVEAPARATGAARGDAAGGVVRACGCARAGRPPRLPRARRVPRVRGERLLPALGPLRRLRRRLAEPAVRLGVALRGRRERADDDWRRVAALAGLADALGDLGLDAESAAVRRVEALVEAALVAVRRAHGEGHTLVDALNAHLHHANRALGPVKTPKGYDPPPETPVNTPVPWVPPR
ncbi:hypothetical protein JL720_601 [Aureococcus anophagefferens]|nr:hypothetical protein JL720_601 [Aureococcus anophagefferens]